MHSLIFQYDASISRKDNLVIDKVGDKEALQKTRVREGQ